MLINPLLTILFHMVINPLLTILFHMVINPLLTILFHMVINQLLTILYHMFINPLLTLLFHSFNKSTINNPVNPLLTILFHMLINQLLTILVIHYLQLCDTHLSFYPFCIIAESNPDTYVDKSKFDNSGSVVNLFTSHNPGSKFKFSTINTHGSDDNQSNIIMFGPYMTLSTITNPEPCDNPPIFNNSAAHWNVSPIQKSWHIC